MAHAIDLSNGKQNFVSYKQKAWHGLGTVLEDALTVEDALTKGGLNFSVEKQPNIHKIGEISIVSDNSFFSYRTDTNAILGDKLGKDYTILQNIEALEVVDLILQNNKNAVIETAGSLHGGKVVFVCLKLPIPIVVGKTDEVEQYLVISNSHDGSSAVRCLFTPVRVVCQNTLSFAIREATKAHNVRHTASLHTNTKQAVHLLGVAMENAQIAQEKFNQLAKIQLKQQDFWNYVGNIFLSDGEIKDLQSGKPKAEVVSTRKTNIINSVLEYAETGVGQSEAGVGSAWWAYNAVTGYMSNSKSYSSHEARFSNLLVRNDVLDKSLQLLESPKLIKSLSASVLSNISMN